MSKEKTTQSKVVSRRDFCTGALAGTAIMSALSARAADKADAAEPEKFKRKVKIGVVGLGHRGNLIGGMCQKHGGYEIVAACDYFDRATRGKRGPAFGLPRDKLFSGLSGYRKVIESGIEALLILDVPCFYPEQVTDAVDAGLHVYLAKPIAPDTHGVLTIEKAMKKAKSKKLTFLVDYQLPHDKANQEVARRIQNGAIGRTAHIYSATMVKKWKDLPERDTIEHLLSKVGWMSRRNLAGGHLVGYDIHMVDGISWLMQREPVSACGYSGVFTKRHGDTHDAGGVVYKYEDGTIWTHVQQQMSNNALGDYNLTADIMGSIATGRIRYYAGGAYIRGGKQHYSGAVSKNVYHEGAMANVVEFYRAVTEGDFSNPTAKRAIDGTLTAILGREAMARGCVLTRAELIKENQKLPINLKGLKA